MEEVVGEIQDEFDEEERLLYPLDKGQWMVDAKTTINDLVDEIPMEFPEEREYDTLGGFILNSLATFRKSEMLQSIKNYSFKVKSLEENRILKIVLTKMENSDESR